MEHPPFTVRALLIVASIVLFVLFAFGVGDNETVRLGWIGLAVFASAFLVP